MNDYTSKLEVNKEKMWKQLRIRFQLSKHDIRIRVGKQRWDDQLGETNTIYFLLAYHYALLASSNYEHSRYPKFLMLELPGEVEGKKWPTRKTSSSSPSLNYAAEKALRRRVRSMSRRFIDKWRLRRQFLATAAPSDYKRKFHRPIRMEALEYRSLLTWIGALSGATNDAAHNYNNLANWAGNVIDDSFNGVNFAADTTLYFSASRTAPGDFNLNYNGNANLSFLSSSGTTMTLTVTGNVSGDFGGVANNKTVIIGATSNPLNILLPSGTHSVNASSGDNLTIVGVVAGAGSFTKIGAGTVSLNNSANTFTGQLAISAGTLRFASAGGSSLGAGTSAVLLGSTSPATLTYTGPGGNTSRPITISGLGGGTIQTAGGAALTLTGAINNSGFPITLDASNGNIATTGVISGAGSVTKTGTGVVALNNGTNTFTGQLAINSGTLSFASASGSSLGAGASAILLGSSFPATLSYTGVGGSTSRSITINGSGGGTLQTAGGSPVTFAGAINNSGFPLTLDASAGNITLTGIISGAGTLTKTGTGIATLGGTSSYTGATAVAAGTLSVTGSIASSPTTVASGAVLVGTGTTDGLVISGGAMLAPGLSPGRLNSGNATLASGSLFSVEVNGTSAGSTYDQLNVTGTVNLNGATLLTAGTISTPPSVDIVLIRNDGVDPVNGTFSGLPEGSLITINGVKFFLSYTGGDGNDVALKSPDLALTNVQIVQAASPFTPQNPVIGEKVFVRAFYTTRNLPATASYRIEARLDGVPISITKTNGAGLSTSNWNWVWGGWFASPGTHTLQVTLDADNSIAEIDESNNIWIPITFAPEGPTTLPQKFVNPMGGALGRDWLINNYYDVDPSPGVMDYEGGPFTYDGHDGHDIVIDGFSRMDAGFPVYAAADGVVTSLADGNFDRNTVAANQPANFVIINHGNGWQTEYFHLATNTITVKLGDVVKAGQLLGLVGSSGNSTDPHLHFGVHHNGDMVEVEYDPEDYWINSVPYQGDQATYVIDSGITNFSPTSDEYLERPADETVFSTATPKNVVFWFKASEFNPGDSYLVNWYRPDGTLNNTFSFTANSILREPVHHWTLGPSNLNSFPGTWRVAVEMGGVELVSREFTVTTGLGVAGIKVALGSSPIIDNRTTAIDFGTLPVGDPVATQTFTVTNHGTASLMLSNLVLPPGFALDGDFPTTIAAGDSTDVTFDLLTDRAGFKFGAIQFTTNDPDTPTLNFNISGTVVGDAPAGAPVIALPMPALSSTVLGQASLIEAAATVTDADSTTFGGGSLTAEFTSISSTSDVLAIQNAGNDEGQIGIDGSSVAFGGIPIGTFSGGNNATPLNITFNEKATLDTVRELLRKITFSTTATHPETLVRYVRFTLIDDANNESNQPIAVIDQDLRPTTVSLVGGDLVIADSSRQGKNDNWLIAQSGDNLVLTDLSGNAIEVSSIPGATGNATSVVTAPIAALSSASRLILDMRQGVDAVTIDASSGNPIPTGGVLYVGDPALGRGDKLTIVDGGQGTVTYVVDPATGTFAGLPEDSPVAFGSTTLFVKYHGGDGNDVAFVPNNPPTANSGGPYAVTYGDGLILNASDSADPDNDPLSYSWTINGQVNVASGAQPALSWQDLTDLELSAGNSYAVSVTVDDGHGHIVTSSDTTLALARAGSVTSIAVADAIYDGSPQGGSASWISTGSDLETAPLSVVYAGISGTVYGPAEIAPTDAGSYQASAIFVGDANHDGSQATTTFLIAKAASSIDLVCADAVYTGSPQETCSAHVIGDGGLNLLLPVTYENNTDAGTASASASYGGDANHEANVANSSFNIAKADAVFSLLGYVVGYDGNLHVASGSATGVQGEDLGHLLNFDATQHIDPGIYVEAVNFAGNANYNRAAIPIVDTIRFPTDGFVVQTQDALNISKSGDIVATVKATSPDDQTTLQLLATGNYSFRFVFQDGIASVTTTASMVAGSFLGGNDSDFALVYRNPGPASPISALVTSANVSASTSIAVQLSIEVTLDGLWYELGSEAIKAFMSKK